MRQIMLKNDDRFEQVAITNINSSFKVILHAFHFENVLWRDGVVQNATIKDLSIKSARRCTKSLRTPIT